MSASMARDYAEQIAAEIRANVEAGSPFGIVSDDNPVTDRENGDEMSGMEYLYDALDFQYLVNHDRAYRAGRVCIAFGGPTAWIDTNTGTVDVGWWSEPVSIPLPSEFIEALDDTLCEYYEMGA